ncbi:MFS transporter [Methylobacterium sp. JK268]
MRILHPLRSPPVRLLWAGLVLSAVGDQLYAVALAWIGVAVLGPSAGYLAALQSLVILLAVLGIGHWADRWDRRRSMVGADLARALILLAVAGLWLASGHPSVPQLVAAIVVLSAGEAVFRPALQTLLPTLVDDVRLLPAANGLIDATERAARLLGPGLVALLAGIVPVVHFLTLDAVSFLCSGAAIAMIGRWHRGRLVSTNPGPGSVLHAIRRGIQAMRGHPLLGYVLATTGWVNGAWYAVFFLGLPLLIQQRGITGLGGSSLGAYGAVISAYGSTNLIATLVVGSRAPSLRPQVQICAGNMLVGCGVMLLGLASCFPASSVLLGLMASAALGAIGGPMKDIPVAVLRQTHVARPDLAAAMRASMAAATAGILTALLLAPLAFTALGVLPVIVACGAGIALIGAVGLARYADWTERPAPSAT